MRTRGFTKTIVIGRLGHDPVDCGKKGVFPILTSSVKQGKTEVEMHKIYVFGKQKEVCLKHLKKGDLCCIEGMLDMERPGVVAERITFLSNRKSTETTEGANE